MEVTMGILNKVFSFFKKENIVKRNYSWVRDLPDVRDHIFSGTSLTLPSLVDLRSFCPPVLDQGNLGSCTSNAIANAYYFDELKQKETKAFAPSRLFIYYNERALEGTIKTDSGAMIRDGFKVIASQGVIPETSWPYIISKFKTKPSNSLYKLALNYKAISYQSISQNLIQLKTCLASGYPFVMGISVYSSFESESVAKTGIVPIPGLGEQMLGGHAVLVVGYDDSTQRFIVQNSWGTNWGMNGFFTIPYSYVLNPKLASDFWTVKTVS